MLGVVIVDGVTRQVVPILVPVGIGQILIQQICHIGRSGDDIRAQLLKVGLQKTHHHVVNAAGHALWCSKMHSCGESIR